MMVIDWTIKVADLLTLLIVAGTFLYVFYQRKSTLIAEKELNMKIVDIKSIIDKIERERIEREKEIIDRINSDNEIWKHSNEMNKLHGQSGDAKHEYYLRNFELLNFSSVIFSKIFHEQLSAINKIIHDSNLQVTNSINSSSLDLLSELMQLNINSIEFHIHSREYIKDINQAGENYDKKINEIRKNVDNINPKILDEELLKINIELKKELEKANDKLRIVLNTLGDERAKISSEFNKAFNQIFALNNKLSQPGQPKDT